MSYKCKDLHRLVVVQAILAVGAGSMAVNAVKGVLGGGDKAEEEMDKAAKKVGSKSADDGISKALESLRKSGNALFRLLFCFVFHGLKPGSTSFCLSSKLHETFQRKACTYQL